MKEVTECFSRLQMKLIIEDMQRLHDIKPFFSRPTLWKTLFKVRTSRLKFSNLILQKSFMHFRFSMSSIFSRSLGHFRIANLILSIIWNWTERQMANHLRHLPYYNFENMRRKMRQNGTSTTTAKQLFSAETSCPQFIIFLFVSLE